MSSNPIPFNPSLMQARDLIDAASEFRRFLDLAERDDLEAEAIVEALRRARDDWAGRMRRRAGSPATSTIRHERGL